MNNVVIKKSKIHGRGVFANRTFRKGEIVLRWDTTHRVSKAQVERLTKTMKTYLNRDTRGRRILLQSPERYVNHSRRPNTAVKACADIARRTIRRGEEITSNYLAQKRVPENSLFWNYD